VGRMRKPEKENREKKSPHEGKKYWDRLGLYGKAWGKEDFKEIEKKGARDGRKRGRRNSSNETQHGGGGGALKGETPLVRGRTFKRLSAKKKILKKKERK